MTKNNIIIISGPTATGKTDLSIELARLLNGEVVNFDSLLFYKELNIGTAKPNKLELEAVTHHMINTHSIKNPINAAGYAKLATPIIQNCHKREKLVILSGGSGFYLQALINGMYDSPTTPQEITDRSNELYQLKGIEPFREFLNENDKASFKQYHENDHYRIRRAVEHFWTTGAPFSQAREKMQKSLKDSPAILNNWKILHIHLDLPKDEHFTYIVTRVDKMVKLGLIDEVKALLATTATGDEKPMQSIGYKETIDYIQGKFENMEEYKERLAINTRRLAKSQRTWFKKQEKLSFNPLRDKEKIVNVCNEFLGKSK